MPAARACGVGLSAVQLTGRPWAARARAVVGPMAANCRGDRGVSTPAGARRAGGRRAGPVGPLPGGSLSMYACLHGTVLPDWDPAYACTSTMSLRRPYDLASPSGSRPACAQLWWHKGPGIGTHPWKPWLRTALSRVSGRWVGSGDTQKEMWQGWRLDPGKQSSRDQGPGTRGSGHTSLTLHSTWNPAKQSPFPR